MHTCIYIYIYMHTCVYIYIYTYIYSTHHFSTSILDVRGFDSSIILILRGGILTPKGNFPESLSQAILAGMMLVGRLGVTEHDYESCK